MTTPIPAGHLIGFKTSSVCGMRVEEEVRFNGDAHRIVFAPTGSGKNLAVATPAILDHDGPVIVLDTKPELIHITGDYRATKGPVYVLDAFGALKDQWPTSSFNLLGSIDAAAPDALDRILTVVDSLSGNAVADSQDPSWPAMAKDILLTHAMFVVACAKPEDKHLGTVRALASKGGAEQRALLDAMTAYGAKKVAPLARQIAEGAQSIRDLLGADMTYAGVKFQIDTMVASLRSQTVVESMNAPESDPRAIRLDDLRTGKPMTIYIHVPPQNLKSHAALIDLWVSAIITTIAARTPAERPEKNTLIILDECGQYHVTALRMALTLMRGAGLTMCCIFQSPSMLMADYAKDWRAIAENCGVIQAFGFQSATFTESACQILGWSDPQGLMRLGKDQQLVSTVDGSGPFICERPNYLLDARYTSYCNPNPWHRFKEQPQPTRGLDAASRYPQPRTGRSGGPYAA